MPLTPAELRHARIETRLWGYDRRAADRLLAEVCASFEVVWRERDELRKELDRLETRSAHELDERTRTREALEREVAELRTRNERLESELVHLREAEQVLGLTLVAAKSARDELRAEAQHEIQGELENARAQAKRVLEDADWKHTKLTAEILELEALRGDLVSSLRGLITSAIEALEVESPASNSDSPTLAEAFAPTQAAALDNGLPRR
jgi:cell division septum initiation protein DivIVA